MAKVEKTVYWCDNPDCPEYKKEHYASHKNIPTSQLVGLHT